MSRKRKMLIGVASALLVIAALAARYISSRPLVFNESFWGHAHCIACVDNGLLLYASEHGGLYPSHTNGYADALAMICNGTWMLTGPGYTERIPEETKKSDIPEAKCGRVYIQGLNTSCDPELAIVFDKKATPGGDHCHGFARLSAPLGREVRYIAGGGDRRFIPCSEWNAFVSQQVEKLVATEMPREKAQWYYDQVDK